MNLLKRLGPHYAIERFGVLFLSIFCALAVLVGFIGTKQIRYNAQQTSGQAIYTTSFNMSQSGVGGALSGLYTDEDHTKVMLLLKFEDMSILPTNADAYSIVLYGSDNQGYYKELESNPAGLIYVFGTTGYMGIYMQDINGFPSQIIAMELISDASFGVSASNDEVSAVTTTGESDTCMLYFNPGGSFADHATFLDSDDWTLFDMIEETMTRNDEAEIRETLRDELLDMARQQVLIEEYKSRLEELDVVIPETPKEIDDTIYAYADKDELHANPLHYITSYGGGWVTEDESTGYRDEDVTYYLDSNYTFPNGFDFEWQDSRILDGYLYGLTGSNQILDWEYYLNPPESDEEDTTVEEELVDSFDSTMNNLVWKQRDGTLIEGTNEDSVSSQKTEEIIETIGYLENAWETYYDLKYTYECETLPEYLNLELQANSTFDYYTINSGTDEQNVITVFHND